MNSASVIVLSVMKRCHEDHVRWDRVGDVRYLTCVPFLTLGTLSIAGFCGATSGRVESDHKYPIHAQVPLRFAFQS